MSSKQWNCQYAPLTCPSPFLPPSPSSPSSSPTKFLRGAFLFICMDTPACTCVVSKSTWPPQLKQMSVVPDSCLLSRNRKHKRENPANEFFCYPSIRPSTHTSRLANCQSLSNRRQAWSIEDVPKRKASYCNTYHFLYDSEKMVVQLKLAANRVSKIKCCSNSPSMSPSLRCKLVSGAHGGE